jgi:secreted PhoX family phosphatase
MPWNSWIACEEVFQNGAEPHGYNFEMDAGAEGPVRAVPIKAAGRFVHEAVAWMDGILYETEDQSGNSCFYRYIPDGNINGPGQLAESTGRLQALVITGEPNRNTDKGFPVGEPFEVEWVGIDDPDPPTDTIRFQAAAKGAALFDREEGAWTGNGKIYFDCTSGGDADAGQIWEFDPRRQTLTLIYESPGQDELESPDNIVVAPRTGDIFICEDGGDPQYIRGVTQQGEIYDFAMSITDGSEFAGTCFSLDGNTLFVNQQGGSAASNPGRTIRHMGAVRPPSPWRPPRKRRPRRLASIRSKRTMVIRGAELPRPVFLFNERGGKWDEPNGRREGLFFMEARRSRRCSSFFSWRIRRRHGLWNDAPGSRPEHANPLS